MDPAKPDLLATDHVTRSRTHPLCLATLLGSFLTLIITAILPALSETSPSGAVPDPASTQQNLHALRERAAAVASHSKPSPMVTIRAGWFLMGSPAGNRPVASPEQQVDPAETPQRRIRLDAYQIDCEEVSLGAYLSHILKRPRQLPPDLAMLDELNELATFADVLLTPPRPSDRELAAWPVFNVTWAEAERYCESLGKRLPTEAEWEKAARGDKGSLYPWGETAPDATRAVFGRRERNALPPVSAVDSPLGGRSPYGLRHMAGNLAEWVRDWFYAVQYAAMPERNPKGPENGFEKVVRGGSWQSAAHELRTAARASAPPGLRSPTIGFRCAKATRRAR